MTRGRPPRLSRKEAAQAALELVDRDGLEALTMQRLAEALGIGTMTLYGYFRDKGDLLDAVVDVAVEDREPVEPVGTWREQLATLIETAHRNLTRHPALVQIRFVRPILRPEALRFAEAALAILHGAGFESDEATKAFRLLFTYTFGFAGMSPQQRVDEVRRESAAAIAILPPDDYPNLTTAAAEASEAMAGEEAFEYGLARILDGLEARLEASGRRRREQSAARASDGA